MPDITEFDLHKAFVIWFEGEKWAKGPNRGKWKVIPAKRPGVIGWHTPNGGERRDAFEGKRLKELGTLAGIPDWWMLYGRLHGIEFKKPGGTQTAEDKRSDAQKALHPQLIAAGAWIFTTDDLQAAKAKTIEWGLAISAA